MEKEDMVQLIENYLRREIYNPKERENLRKLLLERKNTSFIYFWEDEEGDIRQAVKETVISDSGGKTETLQRMKRFTDYLNRQGICINLTWPPINDIGNRYERIIYILREMQTVKKRKYGSNEDTITEYLSEKLWVSKRTIEDDITFIMPPIDHAAPQTFFKQSLAINGMKRSGGNVQFASTAHPLFLIESTTNP